MIVSRLINAEIWSPAGGFYADPRHWRRNTLIAIG